MRNILYGSAALAVVLLWSPAAMRSALATSASALFEATPFLFGGLVLSRLLQRRSNVVEYLGCGCMGGPSARSLPSAAATWLVFGPGVALARYAAATFTARILCRGSRDGHGTNARSHLLCELASVLPAALVAGVAMQCFAAFDSSRISPIGNALLGAALGFTAAPCGLGAVAIAGALRFRAPVAAAAFLCVAGIIDLPALRRTPRGQIGHDAFAYAVLAIALAIVAWHHGGALVHPRFAVALAVCSCAAFFCTAIYRRSRSAGARAAPVLMLAAALLGAPAPQYHATETTLSDLFAGERLTFTGAFEREQGASIIVRYAITCCRADAAPVAVRLDRPLRYAPGTWLRVDGRIESIGNDFRLIPTAIERVPAPVDPFIYR
jgi:hypothetical protein